MQNQTSDRKDFICNPSRWSKAVLSPDVPCVDRGSIKRTPPCLSHCCALLVLHCCAMIVLLVLLLCFACAAVPLMCFACAAVSGGDRFNGCQE